MKIRKLVDKVRVGGVNYVNTKLYDFLFKKILDTPIIPADNTPLVTLSAVSKRDFIMYLCAIKSFRRYLPVGRIVIVDDGSLDANDYKILDKHLDNPEIVKANEVETGQLPVYISWRRFSKVLSLTKENYVISIDSDTLTFGEIPEVIQAYEGNYCFGLSSNSVSGKQLFPMKQVCEKVKEYVHTKKGSLQATAESNFDQLRNYDQLKYARLNGGFGGYAKNSNLLEMVEDFSLQMENIIGKDLWWTWGSQQVSSNYAISNAANAQVLPYPKYAVHKPGVADYSDSTFLHFIGSHRFKKREYFKRTKALLQAL